MIETKDSRLPGILGLDIGGTKVYAGGAQGEKLLVTERFETPGDLEGLLALIDAMLRRAPQPCESIGIGVAGGVRGDGTLWIPNLPWLTGIDLRTLLRERCGLPVRIENDSHAALYGEHWLGAAQGQDNVILLAIGTGIGGAFLVDGRILAGAHGTTGSVGWLPLGCDPDNGAVTNYETLASGSALHTFAKEQGYPDSFVMMEGYRAGEAAAKTAFESWAAYLGFGIAALASVMDPACIIITGGMSREYEAFHPILQKHLAAFASPMAGEARLCKAQLGDKAGLYGAVRLGQLVLEENNPINPPK